MLQRNFLHVFQVIGDGVNNADGAPSSGDGARVPAASLATGLGPTT